MKVRSFVPSFLFIFQELNMQFFMGFGFTIWLSFWVAFGIQFFLNFLVVVLEELELSGTFFYLLDVHMWNVQ